MKVKGRGKDIEGGGEGERKKGKGRKGIKWKKIGKDEKRKEKG